ncbi:putative Glycoprotein 3-alpha-L-fucosyltransferase A [Hypsibius exemplaris]|uniref:Fucosyltransferase n=1 Tax=Hypsibius exemplaris TaxID=2072580 RepID=A0A1W0XE57_HYPEX|nr:putative Glycoprotein 3-alpha-L-fucosyltransferase A [Hypsibius exemplaris]
MFDVALDLLMTFVYLTRSALNELISSALTNHDDLDTAKCPNLLITQTLFPVRHPRGADVYTVFQEDNYLFANPNRTFLLENISSDTTDKLILLMLDGWEGVQTKGSSIFGPCPENRCALTTNRANFNRSAAVVYLASWMKCELGQNNVAPVRAFPEQVFVYAMGESAIYGQPCGYMLEKDFFNWTLTYRLDSDIRAHYTYRVPLEKERRNFAAGKRKMVVWIVSHCQTSSEREKYVRELRKYVAVDVYGRCGNLSCGRNGTDEVCLDVMREYKFYLSFENSMCRDYVTEKMIRALEHEIVPIVYGDGNYLMYPPKSYIHTYDYSSPARLAEYLNFQDKNDEEYNKHMEWRYNRRLIQSSGEFSAKSNGFCRLCQKLHSSLLSSNQKSYPSIKTWWDNGVQQVLEGTFPETVCRRANWLLGPMNITDKTSVQGFQIIKRGKKYRRL